MLPWPSLLHEKLPYTTAEDHESSGVRQDASAAARTSHRRCHDDLTRRDMAQGDYIHVAAQRRWRGARIHELVSAEVAESRWKLLVEVVLTIGWCTAAKILC